MSTSVELWKWEWEVRVTKHFQQTFRVFFGILWDKTFQFSFQLAYHWGPTATSVCQDLNMLLLQEAYFNSSTSVNTRLNALLNRGCQPSDTCLQRVSSICYGGLFLSLSRFVIVEDTRTIRQLANIVKLLTLGHHCMTIKIFKFRVSSFNSEGKISQTVYFCDLCLAVLSHRL